MIFFNVYSAEMVEVILSDIPKDYEARKFATYQDLEKQRESLKDKHKVIIFFTADHDLARAVSVKLKIDCEVLVIDLEKDEKQLKGSDIL